MKYKKKRKNNTVIPYYVDNDNEILFNLAICIYWSACTQAWKVSGHVYVCWKIGFASFYYDFLVYEVLSLVIIVDYIYTIQLEIKDTRCLATGRWFSPGTPVSSNNKSDRHAHDVMKNFNCNISLWFFKSNFRSSIGKHVFNLI
jgi:hypothetical protein